MSFWLIQMVNSCRSLFGLFEITVQTPLAWAVRQNLKKRFCIVTDNMLPFTNFPNLLQFLNYLSNQVEAVEEVAPVVEAAVPVVEAAVPVVEAAVPVVEAASAGKL